jgi:hypothetical protein
MAGARASGSTSCYGLDAKSPLDLQAAMVRLVAGRCGCGYATEVHPALFPISELLEQGGDDEMSCCVAPFGVPRNH